MQLMSGKRAHNIIVSVFRDVPEFTCRVLNTKWVNIG